MAATDSAASANTEPEGSFPSVRRPSSARVAWLDNTEPSLWWDSTEPVLWCDSHEPRLCDDPIENPSANDPTLPMLANEPTDPIDSTEPSDHSDSTEPRDPIDQRHEAVAVPTCWSPSRPSTPPPTPSLPAALSLLHTPVAPHASTLDGASNPLPLPVMRTYEVRTYGCQMNVHDSERLSGLLEEAGYVAAPTGEDADVVVFNTCAVRENADNKLYGNLGHLAPKKAQRPGMQIAVGGCLAQKDRDDDHPEGALGRRRLRHPQHRHRCRRCWSARASSEEAQVEILESLEVFPSTLPTKRESAYAAWVSVSVGCNNTCTFCIVPSLRGKEKDRRPGEILGRDRGAGRTRASARSRCSARTSTRTAWSSATARPSASCCAPAATSTGSSGCASPARTRRSSPTT